MVARVAVVGGGSYHKKIEQVAYDLIENQTKTLIIASLGLSYSLDISIDGHKSLIDAKNIWHICIR